MAWDSWSHSTSLAPLGSLVCIWARIGREIGSGASLDGAFLIAFGHVSDLGERCLS